MHAFVSAYQHICDMCTLFVLFFNMTCVWPSDVLIGNYLRIVIYQFLNNFHWVIATIHDSFLNCSYQIRKAIKLQKNPYHMSGLHVHVQCTLCPLPYLTWNFEFHHNVVRMSRMHLTWLYTSHTILTYWVCNYTVKVFCRHM